MNFEGKGELRFMGPDAQVDAAENSTRHETGEETRGGTPHVHERVMRWVVVKFENATLTLDSTTPWLLAARDAPAVSWDGNATAKGVRGYLNAQNANYETGLGSASAYFDGAFVGHLSPSRDGESAWLRLEGALRSTSLQPSTVKAPSPAGVVTWPWLIILSAAVLLSAGGAIAGTAKVMRHRQRKRIESLHAPFALKDCKDAALSFIGSGEYQRALTWLDRARTMAPRDGVLAGHEAFCLAQLGRVEDAFATYAEADRLSPGSGDAAMSAARLLRQMGAPLEEAYLWLRIALDKSPEVIADVRDVFPEVLELPEWEDTLERARRRLEESWTSKYDR